MYCLKLELPCFTSNIILWLKQQSTGLMIVAYILVIIVQQNKSYIFLDTIVFGLKILPIFPLVPLPKKRNFPFHGVLGQFCDAIL